MVKLGPFGVNYYSCAFAKEAKTFPGKGRGPVGSPLDTTLRRIYLRVILSSPEAKTIIMILTSFKRKLIVQCNFLEELEVGFYSTIIL